VVTEDDENKKGRENIRKTSSASESKAIMFDMHDFDFIILQRDTEDNKNYFVFKYRTNIYYEKIIF
jgi:hypothetical protein